MERSEYQGVPRTLSEMIKQEQEEDENDLEIHIGRKPKEKLKNRVTLFRSPRRGN